MRVGPGVNPLHHIISFQKVLLLQSVNILGII